MKLEIGKTYSVLKTDNKIVTFRFIGNFDNDNEVFGLVDGHAKPFSEIFENGYLCYWETEKIKKGKLKTEKSRQ